MCKVSIIIPVYNTEKYLQKCLDSIIRQTLKDIEIICVNDGSTDGSSRILDGYAVQDPRIKVIHKENGGLVSARKNGLSAATGKYIGYVDSDDWIEPEMYERLYRLACEQAVDVVMCGRYEDSGQNSRAVYHGFDEGRYDKEELIKSIYPNMIVNKGFFEWGIFPGVWDKLFRRECLEKFQMAVDERLTMGEDAACVYPCLLNVDSIYILRECLYHYRQTVSSMVKKISDTALERQRFRILYQSVLNSLYTYRNVYDLCEQWRNYLLFLMTPRAGDLYLGMEELDYLFPFPGVKKGSRIILYGMGTYGQHLYKFLKRTVFCKVIACVDKNYIELTKQGLLVEDPDKIGLYKYDAIVIANSFAKSYKAIYMYLAERYPAEKVHIIDEKLIKSDETLRAFNLVEHINA